MKYLLIIAAFSMFTSIVHAQTQRVQQCVIEKGILKAVVTDYDPATGYYSVFVDGQNKSFDEAYPNGSADYAGSASWYINNEPITLNGKKYVKYALPRMLSVTDIKKTSVYKNVGVYVAADAKGAAEIIYIPVKKGCEFQPYQKVVVKVGPQKIYYSEYWEVSSQYNAAYYRLVTLNASGKPVGLVKDFYITGEKQWEGNLSYLDLQDGRKDIAEGVNTWFYLNGKKASQVTMVRGKEQGVYRYWSEEGQLREELDYKNGIKHGYHKTYLPNGKLSTKEHYTNGEPDAK